MALHAGRRDLSRQGPASTYLDHITQEFGAGRLSDKADIHPFAFCLHPVEDGAGAVSARALLVAGYGQDDRTVGRTGMLGEIYCRRHKGCNA